MKDIYLRRRKIAIGLLLIWSVNLLLPSVTYAITSGPQQPEARSFQAAGVFAVFDA